ncbi:MAG: tetratricopeptide repeat protein [Verrucomicrobiota bacterium]|nr:tetratricopeptide repeat protein [Verrucomicrobiota bacterium]
MNMPGSAISVLTAGLIFATATFVAAQRSTEVRRAQPVEDPPIARALPVDAPTPVASVSPRKIAPPAISPVPRPPIPDAPVAPRPRIADPTPTPAPPRPSPATTATPRSGTTEATDALTAPEPPPAAEVDAPDRRQLDYANALFGRKLHDLAIPEYEKFVGQYSSAPGRASAYFYLAECYRALNRSAAARTAFQSVLDEHAESEFAGPAAYGVAEILFNQKDFAGALALFHRSAAKSKEAPLALSARYFEARCLENLERKEEAGNLYLQVVDAKNPNPYREDARLAAGSILVGRGRKSEGLKQYEALANETGKPALKAEATVRAAMVAIDLHQADKTKPDKAMLEKATILLQKGRSLPEAGRWRGIAEAGLLRLLYSTGQHAQLLAEYKKSQAEISDDVRPELMLLAANSERHLGHVKEAEAIYAQIVARYPTRDEAKDASYQRLINIYNSNPSGLVTEVDQFLAVNPTGERADQARLLKAEAFYKQGNFVQAAPLYETLRASQLSPKLRAECAYKLGWCYVQMKSTPRIVEAFTYFLKAFPDNAQAPSALTQRALAYQEARDYEGAIADLNTLLATFPAAREREAALQQKALLMGQQENARAMTEAFGQLLKEFPKSPVAAQANYYIGKAAFEEKDYKAALPALEASRKLNKEQYYTPATVRIVSAYFYQKNRAALTTEIDNFLGTTPEAKVPAEILHWLGIEYYNEKNYALAEKYLTVLGSGDLTNVKPDFWFYLADAQTKSGKFAAAEASYERYLQTSNDPAAKVKTLLALGATKIAAHKADEAQKIADEIMGLQPEGRVNAEARLLAGDVQIERGHFDEAGKAYMGVALLYDDPTITPRALQKAAGAYEKAGKKAEADRAIEQLRTKYPGFATG